MRIWTLLISFCAVFLLAATPDESLEERFDELMELRHQGEFSLMLEELEALHKSFPDDAGVLWRMARTRADVADRTESEERRKALFLQSLEESRMAVELDPESSEAVLTKAIAAGRAGMVSGTRQQVELSRQVKELADRAIELDESNDLAYHVRGRWHFEVAGLGFFARNAVRIVYGGLPGASMEQAKADYRRAIELEDRVVHRYELGRVLLELDRRDEARQQFQTAIAMPYGDVTDVIYKERSHRLLMRMR